MKLGEALTLRSLLTKEITEARDAAIQNLTKTVKVQSKEVIQGEGNEKYLDVLAAKQQQLTALIIQINHTNAHTNLSFGDKEVTLSSAISQRDFFLAMAQHYKQVLTQLQRHVAYGRDIQYGVLSTPPRKTLEMLKAEKEGVNVDLLIKQQEEDQVVQEPVISYQEAVTRYNQFAKQHRQIDIAIQEANWKTDLI